MAWFKINFMDKVLEKIPGVVLVVLLTVLVVVLDYFFDFSATILAISLGFVVANLTHVPKRFNPGVKWIESNALASAVALLGIQLNLMVLLQINPVSIAIITGSILVVFTATFILAKVMRISGADACLMGSGQAICGSAAVMAAFKVISSGSDSSPDTTITHQVQNSKPSAGLIVAVVNFLGFLGVFLTPWLVQTFFYGDDVASGFLIGNTLQSMGHVVAAGFSVNDEVGQSAVLIKMCRILFLIPTLMVMIVWVKKQLTKASSNCVGGQIDTVNMSWFKLVPMFIWGFLIFILINNLGLLPVFAQQVLIQIGDVLFILAMVAIGLNIKLKDIWQQGGKLLLLGAVIFSLQITFTLVVLKVIQ